MLLSRAQGVVELVTPNPTAAALAVHGRACAAREVSKHTMMATKRATGIPTRHLVVSKQEAHTKRLQSLATRTDSVLATWQI